MDTDRHYLAKGAFKLLDSTMYTDETEMSC